MKVNFREIPDNLAIAPLESIRLNADGSAFETFVAGGGGSSTDTTASNQGSAGVGVFHSKVGTDLQFKNINAGSNKVSVSNDAGNKEIDIDVVPGNLTGIPQSAVVNLATSLSTLGSDVSTVASDLATLDSEIEERSQDAVGLILVDSDSISWTYNDAAPSISAEVVVPTYALRLDDASPVTYVGEALPGTAESAAAWRIKKITETGSDIDIEWADGVATFTKVWDDHLSLSYA